MSHLKHYVMPLLGVLLTGNLLFFDSVLLAPLLRHMSDTSAHSLKSWVIASFYLSLAWLLARYIRVAMISSILDAGAGRPTPKLLPDIIGLVLFLATISFVISNVFAKDITALVAITGVSVIILGIALKDLMTSVFSGWVLNFEQPFKIGDVIECNLSGEQVVGKVVDMNWRTTHLQTVAQNILIIPNRVMTDSALLNYNLPDKQYRTLIQVFIDYEIASESAERILQAAVLATEGVLKEPKPSVSIGEMQRDCLVYQLLFWSTDWESSFDNRHHVIKNILKQMQHTNIQVSQTKSEVFINRERSPVAHRTLDKTFLLSQIDLFRLFPAEARDKIVARMLEQHYPRDEEIIKIGQKRDALFIVAEGLVNRVIDDFADNPPVIQKLVATEFFGALSLFTGKPHMAAVVSQTNVVIYEITRAHMQSIMRQHRQLVGPISEVLAQHQMQLARKTGHDLLSQQQALEELKSRYIGQILSTYF